MLFAKVVVNVAVRNERTAGRKRGRANAVALNVVRAASCRDLGQSPRVVPPHSRGNGCEGFCELRGAQQFTASAVKPLAAADAPLATVPAPFVAVAMMRIVVFVEMAIVLRGGSVAVSRQR